MKPQQDRLTPEDRKRLEWAMQILEHPSFLARLADRIGTPVSWLLEKAERRIPGGGPLLHAAVAKALRAATEAAIASLGTASDPLLTDRRARAHRWAVAVTGAVGGAFGLPALAVELPITTTLILRSIADIARAEGEDLGTLDARLACLQVFALGGPSPEDDAIDSAYFATRIGLQRAARHLTLQTVQDNAGRSLSTFIAKILPRFEAEAADKLAAQAAPVIGAAGGALVNTVFIAHFQSLARAHFTVRRLERIYGPHLVRSVYLALHTGAPQLPASGERHEPAPDD